MDDYTWRLKSDTLIIDNKGKTLRIINTSFEGEFEEWFFETEIINHLSKTKKKIYCDDIENLADYFPELLL
jgi:hypothetical protein